MDQVVEPAPMPEPHEVEAMANTIVLHDLVRALNRLSPGIMDKDLHEARLLVQTMERAGRELAPGDYMVQTQKVRILEHALGRKPTQLVQPDQAIAADQPANDTPTLG